jgi:hypothetical protein
MASFNKFNSFVEDVAEKVHNLGSDVLKVMLTNTAPVATNTIKTNITEITAGTGYTAGGGTVTVTASAQTSGVYKLVGNALVFTATGSMGPFRYAVLYNSTAASGNLIGWYDYGSSVTLASGETFTVSFDGTNGILQLT